MSQVPDLADVLLRLGLSKYQSVLASNGFDDWDTVLHITEDDLARLNFKLGHRRALQREIATFRGLPTSESLECLPSQPTDPSCPHPPSAQPTSPPAREKRRYRRHPRSDANAPKKPKTACTPQTAAQPFARL